MRLFPNEHIFRQKEETKDMLDVKSKLVLKILNKECKGGGYKIIEKGDIISSMPAKVRCDIEELEHIMAYLERHDCINIKYDDDNVYCVALLPGVTEMLEEPKKEGLKVPLSFWFLIFTLVFLGGLLGSFLSVYLQRLL